MARVADLAQSKLVNSLILNTQGRIADRQLQISSLQKSQNYAGISDDSNRLVTFEASSRRIDQFLTDNTFVQLRMEAQLNSMAALDTTIDDLKGLYRDVLDDFQLAKGIDKNSISEVKLAEFSDFLNVKVNGRHLFAGSKTNTRPVLASDIRVAPTYDGNNTTSPEPSYYYKGDDITLKARINEGVTLNYGVTAANPAFEKIFRSIRILRSTDISDGITDAEKAQLQHGSDLLKQGKDQLQALELNIGNKLEQLNSTNTQHKTTKDFFDGVISDLESVNTFEAVAELTQDQTMLEASYATVVRLSKLNLAAFL